MTTLTIVATLDDDHMEKLRALIADYQAWNARRGWPALPVSEADFIALYLPLWIDHAYAQRQPESEVQP